MFKLSGDYLYPGKSVGNSESYWAVDFSPGIRWSWFSRKVNANCPSQAKSAPLQTCQRWLLETLQTLWSQRRCLKTKAFSLLRNVMVVTMVMVVVAMVMVAMVMCSKCFQHIRSHVPGSWAPNWLHGKARIANLPASPPYFGEELLISRCWQLQFVWTKSNRHADRKRFQR